jgi:hypothetical protein
MREFTPSPAARTMVAKQIDIRKRRKAKLGKEDQIFGDPNWEILLILFTRENSPAVGLDELASELSLPLSTTRRCLRILEQREMIIPENEGRSYILASRALSMMESAAES